MQRHFSNRGEALSEAAAAKMIAYRIPRANSAFSNQRATRVMPGQHETRIPETIRTVTATKKKGPKKSGKPGVGSPEF